MDVVGAAAGFTAEQAGVVILEVVVVPVEKIHAFERGFPVRGAVADVRRP